MNKVAFIVILLTISVLININCKKNEITWNDYRLTVIQHDVILIDSIFYTGNRISQILTYEHFTEEWRLQYKNLFVFSDTSIHVNTLKYDWNTLEFKDMYNLNFIFKNYKLSEYQYCDYDVISNTNDTSTHKYFYDGNQLSYVLMNSTFFLSKDSIKFFYDSKGENIVEISYYRCDSNSEVYNLQRNVTIEYDDKNNPFNNFLYIIVDFPGYDGGDFSEMPYFNKNNIINYNNQYILTYEYNEMDLPIRYTLDNSDEYYTYELK
jgi:hypothetical protein